MANAHYFLQARLEGFRGYGGTGTPDYTSVTPSDSSEDYSNGYITLSATAQTNAWGYNALWAPFRNSDGTTPSLNSFWAGAEMTLVCSSTYTEAQLQQYAPWVIRSSTAGAYIFLRPVVSTKNAFRLLIGTDLTDTSKQIDTGIRFTPNGTSLNRYAIRIDGGGTTSGTIILFVDGTRAGSWTGDLTNYHSFDSMSFHKTTPADALNLYYALATNYSIRRSYVKKRLATAQGSLTDWTGDTTTFSTYPVNYNATGGLYAREAGEKTTLTLAADPADKTGYSIAGVTLTAALVTDDDSTVASVAGIVNDTTDSTVTTLDAQSINADGQGYIWNMPVNPKDGSAWTSAALANVEFGLDRTV